MIDDVSVKKEKKIKATGKRNQLSLGLTIFNTVVMILWIAAIILPFMWIIATSLGTPKRAFQLPPRFIAKPPFHFENYVKVFTSTPFFRNILNSLIVSVTAVTGQILISSMAAFGLTRIKFKGSQVCFIMILAGMMVPFQVTIIPLFLIVKSLGLLDSLVCLILPSLVYPLAIFLMRQHLMAIPIQFDEAAAVDGLSRVGTYFYIILPMMKPVILVATFMHLLIVWNDFFRPLILINTDYKMTLPLGLYQLQGYMGQGHISTVLAGVVISIIPPLIIYACGQKYIAMGTQAGGLKF